MKRTFLVLSLPLFLAGCAQIFDANLFSSLDKLPPLDSGKLANASVVDIQQLAKDPTFYTQLKDDPVALTNTQDALNKVADDTNASDPDRITAAATLVTVTTNGSGVADLATSAIDNASTIKDTLAATTTAGQPEPNRFVNAIKIFLAGKTEPEIKITLDNLIVMASALKNMQTLSTIPALLPLAGTIDSNTFFTGSTDQGAFAQSAMMAAIGQALTIDGGGTTTAAAAILFQTSPVFVSTVELDAFTKAYEVTDPTTVLVADILYKPTTYSYAYVATIKGKLPF